MLVKVAIMVIAGVLLAGCGGSNQPSTQKIETEIRPALQSRLRDQLGDNTIRVRKLICAQPSGGKGSCAATATDSAGTKRDLAVAVTVDKDGKKLVWQVTNP